MIFASMGTSALTAAPDDVSVSTRRAYAVALTVADLTVWGLVFLAAAAIAIASALTLHHRPGYVVLMTLTTGWAAMLVGSWLILGADRALAGALNWAALTAILITIVGWPDPPRAVNPDRLRDAV